MKRIGLSSLIVNSLWYVHRNINITNALLEQADRHRPAYMYYMLYKLCSPTCVNSIRLSTTKRCAICACVVIPFLTAMCVGARLYASLIAFVAHAFPTAVCVANKFVISSCCERASNVCVCVHDLLSAHARDIKAHPHKVR